MEETETVLMQKVLLAPTVVSLLLVSVIHNNSLRVKKNLSNSIPLLTLGNYGDHGTSTSQFSLWDAQ